MSRTTRDPIALARAALAVGKTADVPTKWICEDGTSFELVSSGDDYFAVRNGKMQPGRGRPAPTPRCNHAKEF